MGNEKMIIEQTEAEVVRDVKHVINRLKLDDYIQRINSGMMKSQSGFPVRMAKKGTLDFEGFDKKGRFVGMECKRTKGGRVSPEQAKRIELINTSGGNAAVIRSGAEAEKFLLSLDNK